MTFLEKNFIFAVGLWCLAIFGLWMFEVLSFENAVMNLLLNITTLILNNSLNKEKE